MVESHGSRTRGVVGEERFEWLMRSTVAARRGWGLETAVCCELHSPPLKKKHWQDASGTRALARVLEGSIVSTDRSGSGKKVFPAAGVVFISLTLVSDTPRWKALDRCSIVFLNPS